MAVTIDGTNGINDTVLGSSTPAAANVTTLGASGEVTATGFTGTLDGILGSGTPAAANVTTLDTTGNLHVGASYNNAAGAQFGITNGGAEQIEFVLGSNDVRVQVYDRTAGAYDNLDIDFNTLDLRVGTTPALSINSGRYVGIGTAVPGAPLEVFTGSGSLGMRIKRFSSGVYYSDILHADTPERLAFKVGTGAAIAERMAIKGDGSVGIGTTDTLLFNSVGGTTKLAVVGDSASTAVLGNTDASISIINKDGTLGNTAGLHFARADTDETPNYAGASIVAQFLAAQVTGQYPAADMNFLTSTSQNLAPSSKMILTAAGNVGIGTASPAELIHTSSASDAGIRLDKSGVVATRIKSVTTGLAFFVDASSGTAEHMRIEASTGRIAIGTTDTTGHVNIHLNSAYYGIILQNVAGNTGGLSAIQFRNSAGTQQGLISHNGAGATTYFSGSDYRLKENVQYNWNATTELKKLKPAKFNFIEDPDNTVEGFLAHEVEDIVPAAIWGTKDAVNEDGSIDPQQIDQAKLVPLLVKTILELEARITALEG